MQRVAILGGGIGALTAAYELTRPELGRSCAVTLFQQGWRLGGKGASARNPTCSNRIEEHGLHLWMGCYENAFRIIRDCYRNLRRPASAPLATWEQAFVPQDRVVLMERHPSGWVEWDQRFPVLDTRPGESDTIEHPADLLGGVLRWAAHTLRSADPILRWAPPAPGPAAASKSKALSQNLDESLRSGLGLLDRAIGLVTALSRTPSATASQRLHGLAAQALRAVRALVARGPAQGHPDPERDRAITTVDFLLSNSIGILADGLLVPPSGRVAELTYSDWLRNLRALEHLDYRRWLARHGARPRTVESCVVRGLGDAVFNSGHEGAAGTALNGLVRLNLTYRGSLFYRMQAGMGEVVIAPLYQVLADRGVDVRFFHRVQALRLGADRRVRAIDLAVQARVKDRYQPLTLVPVQGGSLAAWPAHPDYRQLEGGAHLSTLGLDFEAPQALPGEQTITFEDFDVVVLGISVAGLPALTEELCRASPRFARMLSGLRTTRTQAVQLWLDQGFEALGRPGPPAVLTGYEEPLDTFADMSHLLPSEDWRGRAEGLAYLCGSLDDEGTDPEQAARVEADSERWLERELGRVVPGLNGRGPLSRHVVARYVRANVHPSERYVLSVPNSSRVRLRADDSGFDNLFLAGDWVHTGLNVGSVEAATMAGRRAARAILGADFPIPGDLDG